MDTNPIERDRIERESGSSANLAGPTDRDRPDRPEQPQRDASDVAGEIKDRASDLTRRARDAAGDVSRQASDATRQAFSQFREHGQRVFTDQKARTADSIQQFSDSLHHAAERLRHENDNQIATYVEAIADTARKAESYIRGCDLNSVVSDARTFAKKNPTWFLGAAFLAGLAVARFAKASDPGNTTSSGRDDLQPPSPGFDRALGDYQQGPTGTPYPSYGESLDRAAPAAVPVGGSLHDAPDTSSSYDANASISSTSPRTTDPDLSLQSGGSDTTVSDVARGDSDFPVHPGTGGQDAVSGLTGSQNASGTSGDPDLEPRTKMAEIKPPETECGTEVRNG